MKTSATTIIALLAAVLSEGCAQWMPASDPSVEKDFLGFSIQPPVGQGWFVVEQGFNYTAFVRQPERKSHWVIATASSRAVDEDLGSAADFLEYVERTIEAERPGPRFQSVIQKVSPLRVARAQCARVDFTAEDHEVPYAPESVHLLRGFDILCLHPDASHMLVDVGYSQRFEKGGTPLALEGEIEFFTGSLAFDESIKDRFSIGPLMGVYAYDKFVFFPGERDPKRETLLMRALGEGGCKDVNDEAYGAAVYTPSPASEQDLAIEYDVHWHISATAGVTPSLGCVLGKVGRWSEALDAFRAASKSNPTSTETMGNVGVAAHAVGRFEESVEHFRKATALDSHYFQNKRQQRAILGASEKGVSVFQ